MSHVVVIAGVFGGGANGASALQFTEKSYKKFCPVLCTNGVCAAKTEDCKDGKGVETTQCAGDRAIVYEKADCHTHSESSASRLFAATALLVHFLHFF